MVWKKGQNILVSTECFLYKWSIISGKNHEWNALIKYQIISISLSLSLKNKAWFYFYLSMKKAEYFGDIFSVENLLGL